MASHFGTWLARKIEDLGLTRRQYASSIDVGLSTVNRWLSGEAAPQGRMRSRIASSIGVGREEVDRALSSIKSKQVA